ncbi:conserved hypothetical protein [Paraburkholderia ribeironis]|uniref:Uncharacterized protein n=1 Tax=Paraburkholderia ribeironis TaxID=1247936 RepID=A0A1N7RM98_9BURK|nr:conserved hypothetical protein [Paraburkholderia ribeironis]
MADLVRASIFDVTGRLPPMLLGLPLVLSALCIACLVGGATFLLCISCALAGFLANITPGATLLSLLRRPACSQATCQEHRSDKYRRQTDMLVHDAISRRQRPER